MKTKKIILGFVFAIFGFTLVNGQVKVAATLGTYNSTTNFEGASVLPDLDPMRGVTGGIQIAVALDEYLSVMSGVNYKKRGFSTHVGTAFNLGNIEIPIGVKAVNRIDYIEVPLMLKYLTPRLRRVQPYIAAGPALSYAKSASIRTVATAIINFNVTKTELDLTNDDFNRTGLTANLAAGFEIPYRTGFFLAELGYDKALTNFTSGQSVIDLGVKHHGWGAKVGYGIRF